MVLFIPMDNQPDGKIFISYQTCLNVGEDWNDDMWETGKSEILVSTLFEE
jgi:hypothetical protein